MRPTIACLLICFLNKDFFEVIVRLSYGATIVYLLLFIVFF